MKKPPIIWTNVLFFSITFLAAITLVPWYGYEYGYTATHWAVFTACMFYAGLSITAGYHRLWAHKAYDAHPVIQWIFAIGGAFALQNSALHWSSDHRVHHGQVDDPIKDPYAATNGFWYSHIGWMLRDHQGESYGNYSNARDLQRNKIVMFQHRHYLKLVLATNLGIPLLLGVLVGDIIAMLLLAGVLRLVLSQHFTFFINSLAHIWGSRPYTEKNTARDNGFLALFTYGEGYHNFHHIFASDYRNGIRWYHYDPTKWMIRTMAALGLAYKLKRTPVERIEKAKAETLLLKTKVRLAKLPLAQDKLTLLQQEYDLLLKKLQTFCVAQKALLEAKKDSMRVQCDKSLLATQYQELEAAWHEQKQAWLALNARLLKPSFNV
ncbi:fatty acid desaturase [Pseudoalteromonas sp. MMG013]|uniref:acyl-CoA desaturase n=1 Tax=unclassified Pseudoalteromonas TaxID=194690 RepID=UPI001B387969|nr:MULTISPECIES: fatty acid desaturase [unclassified Pseudoalteromonas]MBQ4848077.1 fatty acid desaturase [Pseudoalteromonas sp. MMG005]MBQ4850585.1 fatty acid desaturase [Pseudoalteromonas sp. MMG012]MBQ4863937.1 fatty acid desaturase [Pseudoalteromonas sp. MMG013]